MPFSFENALFIGNCGYLDEITARHTSEIEAFKTSNRREFFSSVEIYFENDYEISDDKLKSRQAEVTKLIFLLLICCLNL